MLTHEPTNRIAEALAIRNIKQKELSDRTGIPQQSISAWQNNKWQPRATQLHKMAIILNVSEMWLAGYDVPMDRPLEQKKLDQIATLVELIKNDSRLQHIFTMLSELNETDLAMIEQLLTSLTVK